MQIEGRKVGRLVSYRMLRWIALALLGAVSATGFAPLFLWPLTLIALAIWMEAVRRVETLPIGSATISIGRCAPRCRWGSNRMRC